LPLVTFNIFLNDEGLQFNIPNHQDPDNPYHKVTPSSVLITARDHYLDNHHQINVDAWLLDNNFNWHGDCRIRVLSRLIYLPEYLQNML